MTLSLITQEEKTAAVSNAYLNHSLLGSWNNFVNKITSILQRLWLGVSGFVQVLLSLSTSLTKLNRNPNLTPNLSWIARLVLLSSMAVLQPRQAGICFTGAAWSTERVYFPGGTRGWAPVWRCWDQSYTPVIVCTLFLCSNESILGHIVCFFLLRCFCSLQLSPLPKLIVTVLEQACPGQIAGKLLEDHEHFDAFAAVLLGEMTGFSPSFKIEIWIATTAQARAASLDWLTHTKGDGIGPKHV